MNTIAQTRRVKLETIDFSDSIEYASVMCMTNTLRACALCIPLYPNPQTK